MRAPIGRARSLPRGSWDTILVMADLERYWDDQAARFDEQSDHGLQDPVTRSAWAALLERHLPPAPARIADLGCGTGTLAVLLAQAAHRVVGLDFSRGMIDRARAKAAAAGVEIEFVVADASLPPWRPGSFDCVLARHVLWALPNPVGGLARWLALLAPGGRLVLVEGRWSTGAGVSAERILALLEHTGRTMTVTELTDPDLWGGPVTDERYLLVSRPARTT